MGIIDGFLESASEYVKETLADMVLNSFRGMVSAVSAEANWAAGEVSETPDMWNAAVFDTVRGISGTVITPIAGIVLTYVVVFELLQLVSAGNNAQNFDVGMLGKWLIKSSIAVTLLSNTFPIVMAIFQVGSWASEQAGAITVGSIAMTIMSVFIVVIVTGRMVQIYLTISLAPIPFATLVNRDIGQVGQNYIKTILAISFQAVLIIICLAVYGALQTESLSVLAAASGNGVSDFHGALLRLVAVTVVLCFTLAKTSSLSASIFGAH